MELIDVLYTENELVFIYLLYTGIDRLLLEKAIAGKTSPAQKRMHKIHE